MQLRRRRRRRRGRKKACLLEQGQGSRLLFVALYHKSISTSVMTNPAIMTVPPLNLELFTQTHLCAITTNNSTRNSVIISGWRMDAERMGGGGGREDQREQRLKSREEEVLQSFKSLKVLQSYLSI